MIVIHHNDLDGRCAAAIVGYWAKKRRISFQDISFYEMDYKDEIPLICEKIDPNEKIFIVDFSFKPEVMNALLKHTDNIVWIDHHKTAKEYESQYYRPIKGLRNFNDKEEAGCELTWVYLFPDMNMPLSVFLIGDRDCWRWIMEGRTAEFNQGIKLYDTSPESSLWAELFEEDKYKKGMRFQGDVLTENCIVNEIVKKGEICLIFRDSFCADYAKSYGFELEFEGYKCFAMGLYMFGSEAFGYRMQKYDICIPFEYDGKKWTVGLYSTTVDVSVIAQKHKGGGHRNASGFTCDKLPF